MQYFWAILGFIVIHVSFSRIVSIPYGIGMFGKWYIPVLLIIPIDLLLIPFYFFIYSQGSKIIRPLNVRLKLLRRRMLKMGRPLRKKRIIREERRWHSNLLRRAQSWRGYGVMFMAGIPFLGGGIWSGVLLARLLKISPKRSYLLLLTGSLMGSLFLALGIQGLKEVLFKLVDYFMNILGREARAQ